MSKYDISIWEKSMTFLNGVDIGFKNSSISLDIGSGGKASWEFFKDLRKILKFKGEWTNTGDDAAVFDLSNAILNRNDKSPSTPLFQSGKKQYFRNSFCPVAVSPRTATRKHEAFSFRRSPEAETAARLLNCSSLFHIYKRGAKRDFNLKLVMATDAFIISPLFFKGGDIGKISMCGTINDLSVMGAVPIGISLSFVIEEGFPTNDLEKIIKSIDKVSRQAGVPVVTGDTKVTEKGKIDKIEITTAGVGLAEKIIENSGAKPGDKIIASGDLGEHGAVILAHRFNYKTKLKSDSQPLNKEIQSVAGLLNACKDPTRGGLAENLNEIAEKSKSRIVIDEKNLPYKKEVKAISDLLGIDLFALPSEGRFIASVPEKFADKTIKKLQQFNPEAKIIGEVEKGRGVFLKTSICGLRPIEMPRGKLIPRIC